MKEKLPQIMAKVDEGMLNVPLVAEVGVGMNWEERIESLFEKE